MKKTTRCIILAGILCVLFAAGASWYSVTFNDARLVAPTDLSQYAYQPKDLPMLLALLLLTGYGLLLAVLLVRGILAAKRREKNARFTRRVDPRMGFLGFAGLFGFLGFWSYPAQGVVFPFAFFIFFGFFGFFYEGRLSNTLMDERYKENWTRAHFNANKTALAVIFLAVLLLGYGCLPLGLEATLILFYILVVLALALEMFLGEYLLYRYDHDQPAEESEE